MTMAFLHGLDGCMHASRASSHAHRAMRRVEVWCRFLFEMTGMRFGVKSAAFDLSRTIGIRAWRDECFVDPAGRKMDADSA
jgi:hypothetical protein